MLGFSVRNDEQVAGIQVGFCNDYNVTMWGYSISKNMSVTYDKCAVAIGKVVDPVLTELFGHMEHVTPIIMEKMGYTPSAEEIKHKMFIVDFNKYLEILQFVKNLDIQ